MKERARLEFAVELLRVARGTILAVAVDNPTDASIELARASVERTLHHACQALAGANERASCAQCRRLVYHAEGCTLAVAS